MLLQQAEHVSIHPESSPVSLRHTFDIGPLWVHFDFSVPYFSP